MASAQAEKLCPQLIILAPRFNLYRDVSRQMHEIFARYSDCIEPLSLDEAFLKLENLNWFEAKEISEQIRAEICSHAGITVSAGLSINKFLAKLATEWNKPDGFKCIESQEIDSVMKNLPVSKIPGVGKTAQEKLARFGVVTCGDLQKKSIGELTQNFGVFGRALYERSRGIDDRDVKNVWLRKSVSVERTFSEDIYEWTEVEESFIKLLSLLESRWLALSDSYRVKKLFVKLKFADFSVANKESLVTLSLFSGNAWSVNQTTQIRELGLRLLTLLLKETEKPIRLMGVGFGVESLTDKTMTQSDLFS
jgi:DNA polymerase-4